MNSTAIYAIYRFLFQTVWKAESFVVKNQNIGAANGKSIEWWMANKWKCTKKKKLNVEEKQIRQSDKNVATICVVQVRQIGFTLIFNI